MTGQQWLLVARILRPQGRRGEVLADILTDFPEKFAERKRLFLLDPKSGSAASSRELQLEDHWLHKDRIVFKFFGIDSIGEADALRGLELAIPLSERAPLEEDAVYISDLIGCELIDAKSSRTVGAITEVDRESTAAPLLVLYVNSVEILIPFVKAYLRSVDIPGKKIAMEIPEGLLDLNASPKP